jgi:hypothetical protein
MWTRVCINEESTPYCLLEYLDTYKATRKWYVGGNSGSNDEYVMDEFDGRSPP